MAVKVSGSIKAGVEAKGELTVNGDSTAIGPITKTITKSFEYPPGSSASESMEEGSDSTSLANVGVDASIKAEAQLSVNGGNTTMDVSQSGSAQFPFPSSNVSSLPSELEEIDVSESPEDMNYTLVDDFINGTMPDDSGVEVITIESTIPMTNSSLTEEVATLPPGSTDIEPKTEPSEGFSGSQCGARCVAALIFFPFLALMFLIAFCANREKNAKEKKEAEAREAVASAPTPSVPPVTKAAKVPENIPEVSTAQTTDESTTTPAVVSNV